MPRLQGVSNNFEQLSASELLSRVQVRQEAGTKMRNPHVDNAKPKGRSQKGRESIRAAAAHQ